MCLTLIVDRRYELTLCSGCNHSVLSNGLAALPSCSARVKRHYRRRQIFFSTGINSSPGSRLPECGSKLGSPRLNEPANQGKLVLLLDSFPIANP